MTYFSLPASSVPAFSGAQGGLAAVCGGHASVTHVSCQVQLQGQGVCSDRVAKSGGGAVYMALLTMESK